MTLLAYSLTPSRVDIVTDTLSYRSDGSGFGRCSKAVYLPHIDTAVASTGSKPLGLDMTRWAARVDATDVDDFAGQLERILPRMWAEITERGENCDSKLYAFGWSRKRSRYVGYFFVGGGVLTGSKMEWVRFDALHERPDYTGQADACSWMVSPTFDSSETMFRTDRAPDTVDGWIGLAQDRRSRPLSDPTHHRVLIGGHVQHTVLTGGASTQTRIHTFVEAGAEWAALVAEANPKDVPDTRPAPGRNDPCSCGSGRKYKQCCLSRTPTVRP